MATYSFLSVQATLSGPGVLCSLANGAGASDEGVSFKMSGDKNTMTPGADGSIMNSLHAAKNGEVTVSLLKTSPINAILMQAYNQQTSNPALHGQNTLSLRDTFRGDVAVARQVAFKKLPDNVWGKDGAMLEWSFDAGFIDETLGTGLPSLT